MRVLQVGCIHTGDLSISVLKHQTFKFQSTVIIQQRKEIWSLMWKILLSQHQLFIHLLPLLSSLTYCVLHYNCMLKQFNLHQLHPLVPTHTFKPCYLQTKCSSNTYLLQWHLFLRELLFYVDNFQQQSNVLFHPLALMAQQQLRCSLPPRHAPVPIQMFHVNFHYHTLHV